ncbi:unnamed protein product [Allacma fusca]|uniref:Uncharacterized protein n=1 Tax=Allacma fusca TaxID=39272 RepID=A0A8J2L728_9HEXA|nr:unnamed protein product [Allacma fusca]
MFVSSIPTAEEDNSVNGTKDVVGYRRRFKISIPEPVVCFPGFEEKLLKLENMTLLEEIYMFKVVKPSDILHAASLSTLYPPVFVSLKILYVLLRYAEHTWLPSFDSLIVDAKIEASVAGSEIAHLRAKIETIYNRLSTVTDDQYPEDVKRTELIVAVDKSEEILSIFRDPNFIFMKNPTATMPFLVLFAGPCKVLLEVATVLVPSKEAVYGKQLEQLNSTVEQYKAKALNARLDGLYFDKVKVYPNVTLFAKNLWDHFAWSYDYDIKLLDPLGGWGPCHNVQTEETFSEHDVEIIMDKFIDGYKRQITEKYNSFFSQPSDVFQPQDCKTTCETGGASIIKWSVILVVPVTFIFQRFRFC